MTAVRSPHAIQRHHPFGGPHPHEVPLSNEFRKRVQSMFKASTPWGMVGAGTGEKRGDLFFGSMYEDWTVEASVFAPGSRAFCIASAGCTAMALSRKGFRVTAVDINPAQVAYVSERLNGAPMRSGHIEVTMARLRRLLPCLGIYQRALRDFLTLDDPPGQVRFWRQRLETRRWRAVLRVVTSPIVLRCFFPFEVEDGVPCRLDRLLRERLLRTWSRHPNLTNPYAWRLLWGSDAPAQIPSNVDVELAELTCADAADYLEQCRPGTFRALSLSNIFDVASSAYRLRVLEAAKRASTPDAIVVLRSFAEPSNSSQAEWAAHDRSPLWGSIDVCSPKQLLANEEKRGPLCSTC